ncbi:MAG TPA: hypothetical protein PKA41_17300, partial [Verrucomicrobiota bacterium]|nr:hypothetical protein [Verrucomicrobiota bacterium]
FGRWQGWWVVPDEAYVALLAIGMAFLRSGIGAVQSHEDQRSTTPPVATTAALVALTAGLLFLTTGCANTNTEPRAVAYLTLADVKTAVDKAERFYGDEVAAGRVTEKQQASIDAKIVDFHAAFLVAVRAARADYTSASSPDLDALATSLINLIYQLAPP